MRHLAAVVAWLGVSALGLGCGSSSGQPEGTPEAGGDAGGGRADAGHPGTDAGHDMGGSVAHDGALHAEAEAGTAPSGAWVMGYFSNWDDAANGGFYAVSSIDWDGLTHVAAAFYIPDGKGGWVPGNFDATLAAPLIAAAHAHGKKAIASIGGAGSGPAFEGSTSAANMSLFLTNLQDLLSSGYDGLDIDWEGGNLTPAMDQALETSLIGSLRTKNPTAILTMTAGYENENSLDDLSFYGTISAQLDRINLMTYGMSGAWEGWDSWHSAPLHWNKNSSTPTGIDSSVSHYLAAVVTAAKLSV